MPFEHCFLDTPQHFVDLSPKPQGHNVFVGFEPGFLDTIGTWFFEYILNIVLWIAFEHCLLDPPSALCGCLSYVLQHCFLDSF